MQYASTVPPAATLLRHFRPVSGLTSGADSYTLQTWNRRLPVLYNTVAVCQFHYSFTVAGAVLDLSRS